jgi:hypothetical protein
MLWTLPCVQKSGLLLRRRQADQQNRGRALHLCWISTLSSALLLSPASHHPQTSRFSLTKFLSKGTLRSVLLNRLLSLALSAQNRPALQPNPPPWSWRDSLGFARSLEFFFLHVSKSSRAVGLAEPVFHPG